jgi:hypothetical protein
MKQPAGNYIKKGVSLRLDQYQEMGKYIDLNRIGPFSQFLQDAVDEKLTRLNPQNNQYQETELKAS